MKNKVSKYVENPTANQYRNNLNVSNDNHFFYFPNGATMRNQDIRRNDDIRKEEISLGLSSENPFYYYPKTKTIKFSEKLVTNVYERPYTTVDEKTNLFYNAQDYVR